MLTTEIARALDEGIKLKNTSERLCDNMENIEEDEIETIKNNYYAIVRENVFIDKDDKVVVLFDDSEIAKPYGKKFEDLCRVRDASQPRTTLVNGYHVCEAVALSSNNKQPIPLYSYIYSTDSNGHKSMPDETIKSLDAMKPYLSILFQAFLIEDMIQIPSLNILQNTRMMTLSLDLRVIEM